MHLDEKLTFKEHISQVIRKATVALISLNPIIGRGAKTSLKLKVMLYKSIIRPILLYACPAWAATRRVDRKKLQILQNKVTRRLTNAPWYVRNTIIQRDLGLESIDSCILTTSHNHFSKSQKSVYPHIRAIMDYDPIVEQKFKRPRTVHHDPSW